MKPNQIEFVLILLASFFVSTHLYSQDNQVLKFETINYGKSFLGKNLEGQKIELPGDYSYRKLVVLTSGLHGHEYTEAVNSLINYLRKEKIHDFFRKGGIVLAAPRVNPDGVEKKTRLSMLGLDLNRDFKLDPNRGFQQEESFYLTSWIDSEIKKNKADFIFAVDYHCCGNALIYPDQVDFSLTPLQHQFYGEIFNLGRGLFPLGPSEMKLGKTRDIFGKKTEGTLKNFWYTRYQALSLTYEEQSLVSSVYIFKQQHIWWEKVLSKLDALSPKDILSLKLEAVPRKENHASLGSSTLF